MPVNRNEINEQDLKEALSWLNETVPREPEFSRLVREGAYGHETFRMKLDGDDLASFCHAIHVLYTYFDYDPSRSYWDQDINTDPPKS